MKQNQIFNEPLQHYLSRILTNLLRGVLESINTLNWKHWNSIKGMTNQFISTLKSMKCKLISKFEVDCWKWPRAAAMTPTLLLLLLLLGNRIDFFLIAKVERRTIGRAWGRRKHAENGNLLSRSAAFQEVSSFHPILIHSTPLLYLSFVTTLKIQQRRRKKKRAK